MKIFSTDQIRKWDEYTIQNKPITSLNLMEDAANACVYWLYDNALLKGNIHIFCGTENNGGDGLAIARLINKSKCTVNVFIVKYSSKTSADFEANFQRLPADVRVREISTLEDFPGFIQKEDLVIDAILGTGLNKPVSGFLHSVIERLNNLGTTNICIDIPSGMFADKSSNNQAVVCAMHTLTFQTSKLAFLIPENAMRIGTVHLLNIGLDKNYYEKTEAAYNIVDKSFIKEIYKKRNRFVTKHSFEHSLIIAGSHGKIGAAVLASKACLRSGAGLLSVLVPGCGYQILQTTVPEAMVLADSNNFQIENIPENIDRYKVIGIGPGVGTHETMASIVEKVLQEGTKTVIDADALNILAQNKQLMQCLHQNCIITPHKFEYERLFGKQEDGFALAASVVSNAKAFNCFIILKSHHTIVACPDGSAFFNTTGNPGMATAGSGDVLTGIVTGLLAQQYSPKHAAILGVYLHGLAGDKAANNISEEALIAGDIPDYLGMAFRETARY